MNKNKTMKGGEKMKISISDKNSKLGKIPNISLTPIASCPNCSTCKSKCYALKAYRQYPASKKLG